ncbi:hypothetical protein BGZ70_002120 [Mortierella alpina]|uniref:AMP-dependent synthetase/ligase domain-containing protein n=1 Tax=Mortierella alpina TaxID=64518 RepID=A0A9P6M5M9_MORAP|nr:hypothetical protein BGZ70_002120 [Mortierella alpina]
MIFSADFLFASRTIHYLFEEQVQRIPNAVALAHEGQELTYAELNSRSNALAHHLIQLGVRPDTCVGLCINRSRDMIVGILAIMKAGGAYVPLDPTYPSERLRGILADAAPFVLVADETGRAALDDSRVETWNHTNKEYPDQLCLHHLFEQQAEPTPDAIAVVCGDEALTYGELNARSNNLAHQLISLGVQPDTLVAICVERSLAMIIGILAILKAGGAYVPLDPFYASDRLHAILEDATLICLVADKHGMSVLNDDALQPTLVIVDPNNTTTAYSASNLEISAVTSRHLAYVFYTSGTTGKPKGVMVEHQGLRLPHGPDLTNEKFLHDPFSEKTDARMYKTGDLGKYLTNGNVLCLGRNDFQVKIRGFRIELGEIEARLAEHPIVSEAVVVAAGAEVSKQLVAYVVLA